VRKDERFPWKRISDFVLDVGAAVDLADFHARVIHGIGELVPFDVEGMSFVHQGADGPVCAVGGEPFRVRAFNDYYRYRLPCGGDFVHSPWVTDYRACEGSELVAEWVRPAGIARTLANRSVGYVLALSRSRNAPRFSEREVAIHRVVTRHLHNLFATHQRIARPAVTMAELSPSRGLLSRRESEVARLLVLRLSAREIAWRLAISRRTVERHVAAIYDKLDINCRKSLIELLCRS
jgi:DNA-binding CsgD family transcriptional regulator